MCLNMVQKFDSIIINRCVGRINCLAYAHVIYDKSVAKPLWEWSQMRLLMHSVLICKLQKNDLIASHPNLPRVIAIN
jgi:hypothetical protein